MFLERRLKGACMAAHAAYYDEEYFRGVTGLPAVKWIHCKKTETTVSKRLFLRRQILRVLNSHCLRAVKATWILQILCKQ